VKGTLPADFDYDTEFDGQTGSLGASSIRAWAGYAGVGKTFRKVAASPRVFIEGNYASGTKNPAGHDWNTFDQLYPSNHDKYGFADQVGRRNLVQFRVGVEEEPTKKWKLKQAFISGAGWSRLSSRLCHLPKRIRRSYRLLGRRDC
jgi:Alginate export